MNPNPHEASTEPQRLALEAMSASLIHKLNAMISEQEARARAFAEQHHSTLPTPMPLTTPAPQPQPISAPQPAARTRSAEIVPPPPARKAVWDTPPLQPSPKPVRRAKTNQPRQQEENNIGMGMVIFALIGIILLIRSCT